MKLACVQANVAFGKPKVNAARVVKDLKSLKKKGVDLAVFPEAFLTGYCVSCSEDARKLALEVWSDRDHSVSEAPEPLQMIKDACDSLEIYTIVGFAGKEGDSVFNGAALFQPKGPTLLYKKTHLPELGLDRFVTPGPDLPVFETELGKIGILICFDQRQPEAARILTLKGAELIVLPTNWPEGAENSADIISVARASENRVFYAACNRVGQENSFLFIGRSKIVAPNGKILACAGAGEEIIMADIELSEARNKRAVVRPGEYEWTILDSRRPELYGDLVNPNPASEA